MKRKKVIIAILLIAVFTVGWYGIKEYNRKPKDLADEKADLTVTPTELFKGFSSNETEANKKYIDKIISVKGIIKSIEKNEQGFITLILSEGNSMSSVRCSLDVNHLPDVTMLKENSTANVKGVCIGYNANELLGSDVLLNRCVIN